MTGFGEECQTIPGALLRAIEIPPEGGQSGFADTTAVYEALADDA